MRRIDFHLTQQDRKRLDSFRFAGRHLAREVTRAHILAALDKGLSDKQICQVLGVSRMVIWRTRSAYLEKGLEYALKDAPRSGAPPKYRTEDEAAVAALACQSPPPGAKRWTVRLLASEAAKRVGIEGVSRETVRRWLKKTS
jgi:transposase